MTSERRSYLILAASTIAAVCAFGQSKMTDEMEGEVVSAESVTKTTETETVTKATPQT